MSLPIPARTRAIVKKTTGSAVVSDILVPKLRDSYMLVKTAAVALNPADWTDIDYDDCHLAIADFDREDFQERGQGLRTCNSAQREDGAFADYILVKAGLQMHVPEYMSFEEATPLRCGVLTIGQGLYRSLEGRVEGTGKWILIYGGSSATGTLAIQFAKRSGYKVVTTCSPKNFELVQALGADVVLDYRDPDCSSKIHVATSDSLFHIFDTIATADTAAICANAVAAMASARSLASSIPGTKTTALYACTLDPVLPPPASKSLVPITKKPFLAYTLCFEGRDFAANTEDYDFAVAFSGLVEGLLEQGKIKTYPVKLGVGLELVLVGLNEMRRGAVTGQKLVYRL